MRFRRSRLGPAASLFALAAALPAGFLAGADAAAPREINSIATEMSPRISKCLIQRDPALIGRWLRTLPGSVEENRLVAAAEPGFSACFPMNYGVLGSAWLPRYDNAGIRSALVRALLQARRGALPALPAPGTGAPWYSAMSGEGSATVVAAQLGACLARKHWREVLAIVRAVDPAAEALYYPTSRKSIAARRRESALVDAELSKVIPSIQGCVPAGATLRINRLALRRLLEEAAWHMIEGGSPG
jgi:hypothetical protein